MSTTENTSAIDEKKAEESGTSTTSPDFKGFIANYLSSIIFTIGITIFIIGGLGLYTTKVAQANILPDNIELAPYTIIDRIVNDKVNPIDINIMRTSFFSEYKETLSQKATFNSQEYLDNFNQSFLCILKKYSEPNAGLFANATLYFSFVYDNLVANNFLAINTIFFYLSYLPESIIMLLYGIFGIFLWIGLYFFNVCISIFYHIINIPQFFRTSSETNDKQWESMENISFIRFIKLILFFFLWIWVGLLSATITPTFFTLYGLISPLFATYKIKNGKNTNNVTDFLYENLIYKKFFFFILATLSLFLNGIKYLGNNSIIGIIVAVIFAYFMGLYKNEMPNMNDSFTFKIKQHIRQTPLSTKINEPQLVEICQPIPINDKKMEKLISKAKNKPRALTKPIGVGGDSYINGEENNIPLTTTPSIYEPNTTRLDILQHKLNNLENLLNEEATTTPDIINSSEYDLKQQNILNINNEINNINKEIQGFSQEQNQFGGKYKNKIYNIRWT